LPLLFFTSKESLLIIGGLALLRLVIFWLFAGIANHKLHKTINGFSIPFWDFILAFYYAIMGWISILKLRKKAWR
jgi:hypothetical protein